MITRKEDRRLLNLSKENEPPLGDDSILFLVRLFIMGTL